MSADLSAELSALALQASASVSASASGSATPNATRSAAGSGAASPPSAGVDPSPGDSHAQLSAEGERVDYAEDPSGVPTADGLKSDRRHHGRNGRQLDANERRTVFIPNLPRDATLRELTNMFTFAEGFVKAQLYDQQKESAAHKEGGLSPGVQTGTGKTEFGAFILFSSAAHAAAARDRLHGLPFDTAANPPVVLQARLALKNLFMTRDEAEQHTQSAKSSRRGSHIYGHGQVIPIDSPYTAAPINANGHFNVSPLLSPQHPNAFLHTGYNSPALGPFSQQLTPPALQNNATGYFADTPAGVLSPQLAHNAGVFSMLYANNNGSNLNGGSGGGAHVSGRNGHHSAHHNGHSHHGHGRHSAAGPFNAPCNTLFLARLDALTNDELYSLLVNSFQSSLKDTKFLIDSKGQRIAFVEFDSIESAMAALPRINGYVGLTCAFSKNPLNQRLQ